MCACADSVLRAGVRKLAHASAITAAIINAEGETTGHATAQNLASARASVVDATKYYDRALSTYLSGPELQPAMLTAQEVGELRMVAAAFQPDSSLSDSELRKPHQSIIRLAERGEEAQRWVRATLRDTVTPEATNTFTAINMKAAEVRQQAMSVDKSRLVVYSSDTPDKDDFVDMISCLKVEYNFGKVDNDPDATDADQMIALLQRMIAYSPGGNGFESIALACHGPPGRPEATADFCWKISELLAVMDDQELKGPENPVRRVMESFGNSVVEGGRVDLFACSLLNHQEGREIFNVIEKFTKANFAASTNRTGNPKSADSDWVMESDNVDVRTLYFKADTSRFDGTFAAGAHPSDIRPRRANGSASLRPMNTSGRNTSVDSKKVEIFERAVSVAKRNRIEKELEEANEKLALQEKVCGV